MAHPHGDLAQATHVLPQLGLRLVLAWHRQQHHRHPAQPVSEDDHLIVLVQDLRRLAVGHDLAEHTAIAHGLSLRAIRHFIRAGHAPASLEALSTVDSRCYHRCVADVRPFRALRYAPGVDLATAVCPPFDVISPKLQRELHRISPHNAVRLELAEDGRDPYRRAAGTLDEWLRKGVLLRDQAPAFHLYREEFR